MLTDSSTCCFLFYLCRMKTAVILLVWVVCSVCCTTLCRAIETRQDTVRSEREETEIHLSPAFQKALWNAFSFTPEPVPVESVVTAIPLDRELLTGWLNSVPIKGELKPLEITGLQSQPLGINPYLWQSKNGKYGVLVRADGSQCLSGLDVNALGKYIRPSEIRIRKMQEIAKQAREVMDRVYPTEGLPKILTADTTRVKD